MLCQACGKKTATTHIKTVINGKLTEYHLCSECAQQKGYGDLFSNWGMDFGNLLGGFIGNGFTSVKAARCPTCGASFDEITQSGKIGCADCYKTFREQLLPVIQRIHGTSRHKGKVPGGSALRVTGGHHQMMPVKESPLDEKKRLLKQAIEKQDFETAAVLRDEIKEMENHG
ncbi:uvrB/UvrC domain protein [Clostridium sp. CAG:1013]|nr:uvrB/UvrC domain protein [Clostridium sp. CAG:1013]